MSTVLFSAELPDAGAGAPEVVRRRGKVFEVGDYPDKGFSLTMDEARAAVAAFVPVNANFSHHQTVADGKCGVLESVELCADGSIVGTLAEPASFARWLGGGARKLSLEWDKAVKRIVGVAHALNPRIPDAVVFEAIAAFERGETPEPLRFENPATADNKEKPMKRGLMTRLRDAIGGATDEEIAAFEAASGPHEPDARDAALQAAQAKIAAFEAEQARAAKDALRAGAVAFADGLVCSRRIVAKGNEEYNAALALFEIASASDAAGGGLACFEAGAPEGFSAVRALTALFEHLPAHGRHEEQVTDVDVNTVAIFERQKTSITGADGDTVDVDQLLGLTPLGQQILAAKEAK